MLARHLVGETAPLWASFRAPQGCRVVCCYKYRPLPVICQGKRVKPPGSRAHQPQTPSDSQFRVRRRIDACRSAPRVKSAGALTESRREFERFGREGDANARGSRRSLIGLTQTESAAANPDPRLTPESPTFPPPRPDAGNRPGCKAKPARFRGPVRSSPSRTRTYNLAVNSRSLYH